MFQKLQAKLSHNGRLELAERVVLVRSRRHGRVVDDRSPHRLFQQIVVWSQLQKTSQNNFAKKRQLQKFFHKVFFVFLPHFLSKFHSLRRSQELKSSLNLVRILEVKVGSWTDQLLNLCSSCHHERKSNLFNIVVALRNVNNIKWQQSVRTEVTFLHRGRFFSETYKCHKT